MHKTHSAKKILLSTIFTALILVVVMLVAGLWLYSGKTTNAKMTLLRATGLPLGKVGSTYIVPRDIAAYQSTDLALEKTPLAALTNAMQMGAVAKGKIAFTDNEITEAATALEGDATYTEAVSRVGERAAENTLVHQYVIDAKLRTWYAEHADEPTLKEKLFQIERQLQNGATFQTLAKQYSDDTATKWFAGDTGYVDLDRAVPEYRDQVKGLPLNQRKTVYSRYGVHVVEVLGEVTQNNKRLVRIQEIVLTPKGYDAWLQKQKAQVPVTWYVE